MGVTIPGILSVHDLSTLPQSSTEITFILLINDSTNVGEIFIKAHYEITLMGTGDRMRNEAQFIVRGMELAPSRNQLCD